VLGCVRRSLAVFTDVYGEPPRSYRGGDRYLDVDVAAVLESSGVEVDLSIEPGVPGGDAHAVVPPGVASRGVVPAHPADVSARHRRRGGRVTFAPLVSAPRPELGRVDTVALWHSPQWVRSSIAARLADPSTTHLAFAVRADAAVKPMFWDPVQVNLRMLGEPSVRERIRWVRPRDLALPTPTP
jgi:hypothetical protein